MLIMKQNTNDGLQLACYEEIDGVKTELPIEDATLELKLIREDNDKIYTFADDKFSKSGNLATIDFTPAETKAFEAGRYKIQLAVTDTGKAIALTNYDLTITKTY